MLIAISSSEDEPGTSTDSEVLARFEGVPQRGIALGDPDAPVTMVEFADLQCPFCAEFATATLPELIDSYVRGGDLRLELRLLTFLGPDSVRGAQIAYELAERGQAWTFAELFFSNQGTEGSGYATDEFLSGLIEQLDGADPAPLLDGEPPRRVSSLLDRATRLAQENQVASTPSFLIGPTGGKLEPFSPGSLAAGEFRTAIENALERAR